MELRSLLAGLILLTALAGCRPTRGTTVRHQPGLHPARVPRRPSPKALPKTVDLVDFDLAHFGEGVQVYGIDEEGTVRTLRQERSSTGILGVHPVNLQSKDEGYWSGNGDLYRVGDLLFIQGSGDRGPCEVRDTTAGKVAFSDHGTGLIEAFPNDVATATLRVPGKALRRVGPATVSGVAVTVYAFDARVPWVRMALNQRTLAQQPDGGLAETIPRSVATVRISGRVELDAHQEPLRTEGDLTGPGRDRSGSVHFWFKSQHLRGHGKEVVVDLPKRCAEQSVLVHDMRQVPVPPGATGPPPLGRGASPAYESPLPWTKLRAFYRKSLSRDGWSLRRSQDDTVIRAQRGTLHLTVGIVKESKGRTTFQLHGSE